MATTPKQELHELVERLSDEEARRLSVAFRGAAPVVASSPRPLTEADIILSEPILPDDETADETIAAVHRWRREASYA